MVGAPYRTYLRSAESIVCRHEFAATDDGDARRIAELLADAASDLCDSYEVWQAGRVVVCPEKPSAMVGSEAPTHVQAAAVAAGETILRSGWPVAQSRRLLARLAQWRMRPDSSLLERVIRNAVKATGAHMGNIQLLDGAGNLEIAAQYGFQREFLDYFAVVNDVDTSCGSALKKARRVIVEDVTKSPIFRGKPTGATLLRAGVRSTYSTPIVVRGKIRGMVSTHRKIAWRPDVEELWRIDGFVADAASVIGGAGAPG